MVDDFVSPQANVIEDKDVQQKVSQMNAPQTKFDFQSAQPLKTIPQISTNRSARYQRPLTDAERGEATADYFTGKPGAMEKERRAVDSPEVNTGISALLGGGQEAFGGWTPTAVSALRGIESNKEHPKQTGDAFKDMMNSLHDNAMRGVFEPETTEPTSVHILNNEHLFGKTNYQTAAAVGTLAEFSAAMITNPLSIIPEGFQALSRERQNQLLFNKITQSPQWGDNITAMASKSGSTWNKILPSAQRHLWTAINKGNYMQVVLKNMELYKPFKLGGLTTEDVGESLPLPEPVEGEPKPGAFSLKPTVNVPGNPPIFGIDHNSALRKIGMIKADLYTRKSTPGEKKVKNPKTLGGVVKQFGGMDFDKSGTDVAAEDKKGLYLYHRKGAQSPDALAQELVSKGYLPEGTTGDQMYNILKTSGGKLLPEQVDMEDEYDKWKSKQPIEGFTPVNEGKDFEAGFTDHQGNFYTRDEAQKKYGVSESEDIPIEHRQRAVESTPYEADQAVAPKQLVSMRQKYLENQGDLLEAQIGDLEGKRQQQIDKVMDTSKIEQLQKKLIKKWENNQRLIDENIVGQVKVNEIKNKVGQTKINAIIESEEKGLKEGIRKGVRIGKEKGRIEEVQRKAALELYSRYKQNALDEMKKIAATLQRIKDSTEGLPIEYKEQLDKILKNFDLSKRTGKTIAERESLRKFIEKAKANGDDIKIPQDVLDAAYQTPLNDLTLTQLRDLNNMVGQIYRMGRLKDKLLEAKGLRDLKSVVDEAVKNITGGKGITLVNKFHEDLKKNDPGFWKALTDGAKKHGTNPREYFISNLMPEVQILFLDNIDNGGILYNKLFHPLHEATNTSMDNIDKANKATNDIFNYKKPSDFNKTIPLGNSKIRIDDAMWVYANSVDVVQRAHAQATGVSDSDFEEVEKNLSEEDKMAVRKLWQYYDGKAEELAKIMYEIEGKVFVKVNNYFPIQNLEDVSPEEDLLWENTLRSDYRKGGIDKGMLKTRTGGNKAFKKWNFFGTIGRNIDKVEHYIAFAKAIRNANKIINHPDLKAAIVNHKDFGEFYYNSLRKWVSDTARGKFLYETDWFSRLGRGTRMNLTSAFLGLNPSPALKQWTGLFYGAEMAGKSATLKMLPKMLFNYKKMSAQIDAESSMMRHSSLRQQRELEEMFADRGFFERTGALTAYHKFQAGMMFLTQQSDLIIRRAVYLGTQQALKEQGITDKQHLINEAERVVRRTQPMGGITYLPDIFRGGEGARQLTFLRGHVNKLWNVQIEMIAKMKHGKLRAAQMFSQIIMNNLLPCLWLAAVTGTGIFAVKKAKEEGGFAGMEISQMVTGVPVVEDLVNDVRSGRKDVNLPMIEYLQMAEDALFAKNTKKHPNQKLKKTLEFAGAATGLPVIGAEKVTGWGKDDEALYKKTSQNQSGDQGIYQ